MAAYKTYVQPILDCVGGVWDPFQNNYIEQLERVQKISLRFIYRCSDSIAEMCEKSELPKLGLRYRINRMIFLHNLIQYHFNLDVSPYSACHTDGHYTSGHLNECSFIEIKANADTLKYLFSRRTIIQWNTVTNEIVGYVRSPYL